MEVTQLTKWVNAIILMSKPDISIYCIVEPSSESQKQNQISLLAQTFASYPNMAFSSVWENV